MPCVAYFLTWTTYGTWLHGDERGAVDDEQNHRGMPYLERDSARLERMRARMVEPAFTLDPEAGGVVERAIGELSARRRWRIHAVNARSNHVHLVVTAPSHAPQLVVKQCKERSTRALRDRGIGTDRTHLWTRMASTRWLNDAESLRHTVDYVANHQ